MLEITSEMTQNKTHTQETDDTHTPARGTELCKLFALYYYKASLGRIPDCMNKPFQYSAGAYMLSYSKGSEISVYYRVCPELFLFSYHKKGMKGMFPHLQARSARAERPICRHISATLLTLQCFLFM